MFSSFLRFIFLTAVTAAASLCVNAQIDAGSSSGVPKNEDFPKSIKETLAKQRIEQEKKDYEELLKNGEEAMSLSKNLEKSFVDNNGLSAEDRKKLERLEKIVKKIRKELGGSDSSDDDDVIDAEDKSPNSFQTAFKALQESAVTLFDELKKSTRYTISAVAIQSSNLLLKAVKFLRFGKTQ